jgi:hypothetical protein
MESKTRLPAMKAIVASLELRHTAAYPFVRSHIANRDKIGVAGQVRRLSASSSRTSGSLGTAFSTPENHTPEYT